MPVPYPPLTIANTFLERFGKSGDGIEHMKLQKLVYLSYGVWLATKKKSLTTEKPEVWDYGPVFNSLYHTLNNYGHKPITKPQSRSPFEPPDIVEDNNTDVQALIDWIWMRYGHLSAFALSDMTHKDGTPWYQVAQSHNFKVPKKTVIPDSYIMGEYSALLNSS